MTGCYELAPRREITATFGEGDRTVVQAGRTAYLRYADWGGSGVDADVRVRLEFGNNNGGNVNVTPAGVGNAGGGGQAAGRLTFHVGFHEEVLLRSLLLIDFDGPTFEQAFSLDPLPTAFDAGFFIGGCNGNGAPGWQPGGCVRSVGANRTGNMYWEWVPVTRWQFAIGWPAGLAIAVSTFRFAVPPQLSPAYATLCAGGSDLVWRDTRTHEVIDPQLVRSCRARGG